MKQIATRQILFGLVLHIVFLASGVRAWANDSQTDLVQGAPVLPAEALSPISTRAEASDLLRKELNRIRAIRWQEDEDAALESSTLEVNASRMDNLNLERSFTAYLVGRPRVSPLSAETPLEACHKVRDAFHAVKQKIAKLNQLREYVEWALADYENLLRRGWTRLAERSARTIDAKLDEINACLRVLSDFADSEARAVPDRRLIYTFSLIGPRAAALFRSGFRPKGPIILERARFHQAEWSIVDNSTITNFEGIESAPQATERGGWEFSRATTPSQACRQSFHFTIEGKALGEIANVSDNTASTLEIPIILVSREAPWIVWD